MPNGCQKENKILLVHRKCRDIKAHKITKCAYKTNVEKATTTPKKYTYGNWRKWSINRHTLSRSFARLFVGCMPFEAPYIRHFISFRFVSLERTILMYMRIKKTGLNVNKQHRLESVVFLLPLLAHCHYYIKLKCGSQYKNEADPMIKKQTISHLM